MCWRGWVRWNSGIAVLEVLDDGAEVARRHGVARQMVHRWLRRNAEEGLGGLAEVVAAGPVHSIG